MLIFGVQSTVLARMQVTVSHRKFAYSNNEKIEV